VSTYDEVPYTSYPYAKTHPDRLCTLARLFGMQPANVARCRVLEIGCASGGNLVPMAELLPECEFVGLDGSERQIAMARDLAAAADVGNVRFCHADILELDRSWGTFDYIICHGVYSWVPREVQDKILASMRDLLAPQGVGYVSHNVYPGWHMRDAIRHMMRYHVRGIESSRERIVQSRALIDFLVKHVPSEDGAYALLLRRELQILQNVSEDYLFHEHLEEVNEPLYFHEMVERLARHELAYLGDAEVLTMQLQQYAPEAAKALDQIVSDLISMEQYMDFVRNRQFRATLVCHADVPLRRNLHGSYVEGLAATFAPGRERKPIDLSPGLAQHFVASNELKVTSDRAMTKAALLLLRERWPQPVPFDDLCRDATALLQSAGIPTSPTDRVALGFDLLECFFQGAGVFLRSWVPPLALHPGEKPCTTRVARVQATRGTHVTSVLHETQHLERGPLHILQVLDGTRSHDEIVEALADFVEAGRLELSHDGRPLTAREEMRGPLQTVLRDVLPQFARRGLLVGAERS